MRGHGDENIGVVRVAWAFLGAAALALVLAHASALAESPLAACKEAGEPFATVEATGARDGATIRLADGRELRLAGVIAANDLDGDAEAVRRATAALDTLVAGKRLALHGKPDTKDRYGRIVAQATLADEPRWIAAELVAAGMLRIAPEAGEPACFDSLLTHERSARAAKLGFWAEPRFAVQDAQAIEALSAARGRFAIVEGSVLRVGESGGRTFLDFGRRYSQDFTIVVPRAAQSAFQAAGIDLKAMRGKRIRVRGVLYAFGGPAIEARLPAAIEILEREGS
ncbi:MAG TPA: thermonuclease family protein [Xanthobacteraceae bacterium]|jgi:endonuclease YncB( thermonuclease family)